jgi:thioredoxin 1
MVRFGCSSQREVVAQRGGRNCLGPSDLLQLEGLRNRSGMGFVRDYSDSAPARSDVDGLAGATVLEFGNSWCGHCRRAEPLIMDAFAHHDRVRHIRVADAGGKRLGRTFGIKLWPTLVFLKDGREVTRLVRPADAVAVRRAFDEIDPA